MTRSILITGGLGFIGSYAAEAFRDDGWEVTILDDRRAALLDEPPEGVEFMEGSCEEMDPMVRKWIIGSAPSRVTRILHCASPVGPGAIAQADYSVTTEIVRPAIAVTETARSMGIPLIFISTSEVYGSSGICYEADDCVLPAGSAPRLEYAIGKLAAEKISLRADSTIVRPFNVTGARQDSSKGFVVPNLIEQAIEQKPLSVFEPGTQKRAIMAIGDLCEALIRIAHRQPGLIFNIGAPENQTSILDLAKLIIEELGSFSEIEIIDGRDKWGSRWTEAAGFHKLPGIERAERILGWKPEIDLPEIIHSVAAEFISA